MHPILHTPVGDIPSYTALVAAGFLAAAILTWARHRDRGFSADTVFTLTLAACVAGLAGARAWYVATHPGLYSDWFSGFHRGGMDATAGLAAGAVALVLLVLYARPVFRPLGPGPGSVALLSASLVAGLLAARIASLHRLVEADPFDPFGGGLAMFGGLVAGSAACAAVARARGIPLAVAADVAAPALLAAASLGRLGCFLNGCCTGIPATGPLCPGGRVPTQLIEAAFTAACAAALVAFAPQPGTGRTAAFAVLAYCTARFSLEFLRVEPPFVAGLTASQAAALALAVPAAAWLAARRPSGTPQTTEAA